jgi:hypothetical protein
VQLDVPLPEYCHRYDIAEILVKFGAKGKELDFITACEKLDMAASAPTPPVAMPGITKLI